MQKIYNSVTEMVGRTPLVNLSRLAKKFKVKANILAKCEFYNPVFSVKDRVALKMIEKAEEAGLVREDTVFVEATSGNTGIGLAAVLLLRQFENEANPDAHKFGTSIEILEDTGGDVDCLVSAVGTAGTVSGIASALRTYNPELYVAAVEPVASPVLNGGKAGPHKIPGIGAGFVPKFYDPKLIDEVIDIKDEEAADMAKATARCEGLAVGVSAGAALAAAVKIGQRQEMKGKNIVVILPDAAERYLSTGLLD